MKKLLSTLAIGLLFVGSAFFISCGGSADHDHAGHDHATEAAHHGEGAAFTSAYVCPMHCESSGSDEMGKCPACGMDYVTQEEHVKDSHTH